MIWVPQDGGGGYAAIGGGAEGGGGGGGDGFEFGVDANMDPELAMALRVSLEEERARQGAAGAQLQTVRVHVLPMLFQRVRMLEDVRKLSVQRCASRVCMVNLPCLASKNDAWHPKMM